MRDSWVGRLGAILLIALVAMGGGRLPTVDALVFHETVADQGSLGAHFEASSACHDDGCSVRSVAHDSRLTPDLVSPPPIGVLPESAVLLPASSWTPRGPLTPSNLSRAPPFSV